MHTAFGGSATETVLMNDGFTERDVRGWWFLLIVSAAGLLQLSFVDRFIYKHVSIQLLRFKISLHQNVSFMEPSEPFL